MDKTTRLITAKDMLPLKAYIVETPDSDGIFQSGERIWFSSDGKTLNANGGFLTEEEWKKNGYPDITVYPDRESVCFKLGKHEYIVRREYIEHAISIADI